MPEINGYRLKLQSFDKQWSKIILTGKINSNRIASTLIEFMEGTQDKFLSLQGNLVNELVDTSLDKALLEMAGLSQVAIDILKRNLFERTADVGFLATDDDIIAFLKLENPSGEDGDAMVRRLHEYRSNYSVYNEIVIFDLHGNVRAHLDGSCRISRSQDALLHHTAAEDGYCETFRHVDFRNHHANALVYSQRIIDPATQEMLGILCLCFDFEGEMEGIFSNLLADTGAILAILDERARVIACSNQAVAPLGSTLEMVLDRQCKLVTLGNKRYLAKTARTNGYQGFIGLAWFGHVLSPVEEAFRTANGHGVDLAFEPRGTKLFSGPLRRIDNDADDILSDLELVVLNGEVMAAKQTTSADAIICQEANALPPVLNAIHQVGENIRGVFAESISSILTTVISSNLSDIKFQASLAIDIMDRNLYERANDCRWWALNSTFRQLLAKGFTDPEDKDRAHEILVYINSLYTVYTNIFLFDSQCRIVAASDTAMNDRSGVRVDYPFAKHCLQLGTLRDYAVSPFEAFDEYALPDGGAGHTYIYCAAVFDPARDDTVVGGIGLIFDSTPQFRSMLEDSLARDKDGNIPQGHEAFFIGKDKRIISTTSDRWAIGDILPIDNAFTNIPGGEQVSAIVDMAGARFMLGSAASSGYREYKRDGKYDNDVYAVFLAEI